MLEPKGSVSWNREQEKTWTLWFAPGSQTNFVKCPNVQKQCTGNILAESLLSLNLIFFCIIYADLDPSSMQGGLCPIRTSTDAGKPHLKVRRKWGGSIEAPFEAL